MEFGVGAQPKECFFSHIIYICIIYKDSEKFEGTPNELIKYNLLLLLRLLLYTTYYEILIYLNVHIFMCVLRDYNTYVYTNMYMLCVFNCYCRTHQK